MINLTLRVTLTHKGGSKSIVQIATIVARIYLNAFLDVTTQKINCKKSECLFKLDTVQLENDKLIN